MNKAPTVSFPAESTRRATGTGGTPRAGRSQPATGAGGVVALREQLGASGPANPLDGIALLSGGTDGEDGPTDAAGALIDADVYRTMQARHLNPDEFLARNDAYRFFAPLDALIKTGPTHTNVCDVRIVVVNR